MPHHHTEQNAERETDEEDDDDQHEHDEHEEHSEEVLERHGQQQQQHRTKASSTMAGRELRRAEEFAESKFYETSEALYSVKWYKDNEEFYRYLPKSNPPQHSYRVEGIRVDVSIGLQGMGHQQLTEGKQPPLYNSGHHTPTRTHSWDTLSHHVGCP